MARLRLVGRPGRRFGNKGLRYADGGRSSSDRGDAPKGRLVVSVHRGLRDFVAIAGGDSDDEEDFLGFTEDEILLVIKKTSDLLALVKTSEDVAEPSVEEIGGRLRQRLQKTTAKPFLQLVKSRYMRNSFLTMMPQAAMKRQHVRSLCSQTAAETSLKPMKGSIKVRLFGKGFLLNAANRPAWSKEKRKPREDKNPPITTPPKPLHKEKPSARPAPVKVIAAKTVGRSAKELLLKKEKRLIKHSRVEVKYQLADNKRRLKDKGTEPSPKKAAGAERRDLLPAKKMNKAFMDLKTGSKTLNKQVKRMSKYGEKHGRVEAKSLSSDSNHSQRKTTAAGKRFLQDTNSSLEPLVKIPRLCETGFENSSKKEDIAGGNISSNELGNLSFSRFPENKNLSADVPKKIPMFEAPLICDSKRHRRPAQKLIMKLSEDYEMSLKRSRRSLDSMATGGEMSSGDEKYDTSPKSTKNNRTGQCRAVIPGDDKYQDHLAASKGSRDVGEAGGDRKSIWPVLSSSSSVLVQKNKDIAGGQSEGEDSKGARWRRRSCCVCSGTYKLSRYAGCRVLCCRHCFRFYSSKAKLVMKGSLDLLCVSGGCCSVDWRTVSGCDACRYRRCLQYFPQPEVVISLNSAHKSDSVRQERPQSEFPLAPIAKDSLWNAELLKFLKASQAQEAALGFEVDSKAASLTSESSLGPAASTGPSRRLCKLGKSRTAARMSDTFHELVDHSGTSLPDSSGLRSDSFSTVNSLTYGDKSGAADTRDELKSNEVFRCRTLGAKESTREPLIKCDVKSSCPDALNGGRFSEGPSFYEGQVAALSAEGALQQQSPRKFGGKAPEVEGIDEGTVSEGSERRGDSKGPRIKHVCRKAAVVLGKPEAVFPPRTGLCLSALPSQEKERLFQVEDNSQDSMDVDGTSRIAEDQETNSEKLNLSSKRSSGANAKSPGRLGGPKKTMRCKNCVGCLTPECGVCTACKDMPKNGGRGTLKHACIHRVCRNPILPWHKLSPEKLAKAQLEKEVVEAKRKKITVSRLQTSSAFSRPRGRGRPRLSLVSGKKFQSKLGSISGSGHVMSKVRQLRIPKASAGVDDKFEKNPLANKSSSEQPVLPLTVNVDFNESTDIEDAWKRGLALYSLSSGSLRAACRLCASAGLQELIYCSVCCQPFHSFCLEERDRPKEGCDTWCCLQCQFCHVCYGQSNLLQCDKCQESYHPDCLGPNYPTKPSRRKHIWICSKCVRCRSCGATTPGHEKDATWMCDFSLCYSCGLLMEKGNFCPVCHKCYTDDDWESQMIQCFTCHSWVHSKCEELTDEMYQIVTYMPEDVPFNCRVCCPTRPSVWEILIQQEMQRGMKSVLDALVQCKSSSMLESFQSVRKLGVQETDFATLESSGDGCMAAKQQSSEFPGNSKTVCSDEPQQINSFAKDPENRNPNTSMNPLNLIDSEAVSHSLSLPAVPVVGIADGGSVEPTETLKDVELNGTSGISTDGHLSSAEGKEEKEINAKNITDCQTPILGLTDAMLTASALDNVSSRPNSSSSADGKLRSLLQSGSKFNDYKDLYKDVPHDLMEIKAKLDKENGYTTIESFVADVTRIIRYNMVLKAEEANPLQTGACSAVHSLFIKQMENCFPWFNVKNSRCLSATSQSPKNGVVDQAVHPPSMDHTYAHYLEKEVLPSPPQPSLFRSTARDCGPHFGNTVKKGEADEETFSGRPEDVRCCAFCWTYGDADEEEAGRLVSAGQDDWVHVNCALWSAEVYEEIDGTLQMVHAALARSRKLRCDLCGKPGATVGCCQQGCNSNFHFTCARRKNCAFLETKKVFCELHWMAVDADLIADGNFAVNRRICINPTSARWTKRQWVVGVDPSTINVLIGSLSVDSLGHLSPLSDSKSALLPIDFCVSRLFWSTEDPRQRCIYVCRIVEVTPKAKSPEIISDITVIHDRNDPCYDVQLAKSFTAKDVASDESTLSAFEDDLDLSGSEAEAFAVKLPNITREREESLLNLSHAHEKDIHSVNDEGVLGYPYQSVLDRRHPKWMHLEMQRQESLKMLRSDASSESSLPLTSSDYSQLSASTLRMLGLRSNALNAQSTSVDSKDDSDDEMMLVKIASRLNEAAAKNRRQEFHKRLHEGNGSNSTEVSMSSLDAESTDETSRFGNDTREPETVVARNLVQTDGPPGESDSEDGGSEDFNLVADFSSEDESSRRGRGSSRTLSVEERSLPFNSHTTGNECISSNEDCIYSSAPVDSTVQSVSVDDLKKISDGLLSTDCHLVNDYARTGTSEASLQLPLSSASVQSASTVMPTMSAVESGKNFVAEGAASGVLSFQNPAEIGDGSLRPVVTSCGVQFALSRLLNANDVSYLGSVALSAANPTRLQQVINNLQFPVDPSKAPSPSGSNQHSPGLPSIAPVSFGVSNPPQIQVATPSSNITPQILKSLQQMLGTSQSSKPFFFKLRNSSPSELPPTSMVASSAFPSSLSGAHGPPSCAVLPSPTVTLFNQNVVSAIPLYASSQAVPSTGPVISGLKRHLSSNEDIDSKRIRLASSGGLALSRLAAEGHTIGSSCPVESGPRGCAVSGDGLRDLSPLHSNRGSKDLQKKSHIRMPGSHRSSNDLSNVLSDVNHSKGQAEKRGAQKVPSVINRKSKPEPVFDPHPMFRPHLPEAEVEEEIENSPLLAMLENEEQRLKDEAEHVESTPHLMFEITNNSGFCVQADSLNKAWKAVTDRVQDARLSVGMKPVSFVGVNGLYMTGLDHPAVVYLVEQLPGFKRFHNYKFKYHPPQLDEDDEVIENPHGCARAEQFAGQNKCETFSFLLSRYRSRPEYDPNTAYEENIMANKSQRRSTSLDLPMAMRFRHLRIFAKEAVGVYRSNIHGRGLFCRRDIDAGEMIIEYSGEVIRAILTDKREKRYESKAMGCYMFRKDRDHVIDSTMMGNAARFINHSCDPNCYSKVILVDNRKHIVIFAQRPIRRGEELTYDYKFPIEDVKIPCTCGSRRCRKYLN